MCTVRTLLIVLLSIFFAGGSTTSLAAYIPAHRAASSPAVAPAAEAPAAMKVKKGSTRAARIFQKLLHRIHRALPDDLEGKVDINSLLSFVFGVVSLVGMFFFPYLGILAVPALILGIIGLRKTGPDGLRGKGLAIAGIVTGSLTLLLGILATILVVAFLIALL